MHQLKKIQHHLVIVMLPLFVFVFATQNFAGNSMLSDIDFISYAIKDAYVGYRDKVKGNEFDDLVKRAKRNSQKDTFAVLSKLTSFFKDHHMLLFDFNISKQLIDTVQCKKDSQSVQRYLKSKKIKDLYEGYWLNELNNCVIAIKKVGGSPSVYEGYIVETKRKAIPGYCILKMVQQKDGSFFADYVQENLAYRLFLHARFKNKDVLWVNSFGGKWKRITNYKSGILERLELFSLQPAFTKIDDKTALLKMHIFNSQNAIKYDSLIKANTATLAQINTLIIDIRNNTGGSIRSYFPLFPYIYTNPIIHCGGYTLYSNLYIQDYETKMNKYKLNGDTIKAKLYANYFDSVKAKKGQFDYTAPDTLAKGLPVLEHPKNIAILINNNCLSAAELMLLNFRQSKKVKFFGERTGGAVDYLDAFMIPVVNGKYSLFMANTKRALTTHEPSYDATGILPDVEISDDIINWVTFVKMYYNEHK